MEISENEDITGSENEDPTITSVPVDDEAFETLVVEIKEVLAELAQDKAMDGFRGEYEKLFNALDKSHLNEKRLTTKCQELMSEIANQQSRVDTALDKSQDDQNTIASLKKEIDKAWKMVDMTQEREERARETIEALNTEIQNLTKVIEEKTLGAEDTNLNELRKLRDELTNQRDLLKSQVAELRASESKHLEEIESLRTDKSALESKISGLSNELQSRTNEMNREIRRKERTEREVKQLKSEVETQVKENEVLKSEKSSIQSNVLRLERSLVENQKLNDGLQEQLQALSVNVEELEGHIELQTLTIQQTEQESKKTVQDLSAKDEAISQGKMEILKAHKEYEELKKKLLGVEKSRENLEMDRFKLKEDIMELKKQIAELKHGSLMEKKKVEEKRHEITVLEHNIKRLNGTLGKQQREIQIGMESVSELRKNQNFLDTKTDKQRHCIATLEEERDHYLDEAQTLAKRVDQLLDEIRDAEHTVFTHRKDISEMENQLKRKHNLYEAARSDRTALNKNLTEAQDEISDLKSKLRVLQHQFDQLKEEMVAKETALTKENHERQRLLKDKEELQREIDKCKEDANTIRLKSKEVEKSFQMLNQRHSHVEHELYQCQSKLEQAFNERSLLNSKFATKEEDLATLVRRCHIQEKALARGECKFNEKEEDIRILKLEIKRLKQECDKFSKGSQTLEETKKEVLHLQKELLKERCKVKSLKMENENPLNVHRWRKLEGNDPSTMEMIQKINFLQKLLLKRHQSIVEKEALIDDKDKVIQDLRASLARHPGVDVLDEIRDLKKELMKKSDQHLGLYAENNMYRSQIKELKLKIEKYLDDYHAVKRKLVDVTKMYQKLREEKLSRLKREKESQSQSQSRSLRRVQSARAWRPSGSRNFMGGGYNMSNSISDLSNQSG
ncbi:cilia- and flagella-associated protein 58-like [Tigriopus californicus]|uniref:cilia- and flagella-associated protein 58-like n=1 Tax=Tigriopus californicus TaxID=6832 RepID=UPI0027D9D09F|nr:cilia- and flagella-associated protein 58-like [Tigriopus californicus]